MTADARPLVVIAGKINPAGVAQLESEARVVVAPDLEPRTVIDLSRSAEGILFRAGPRCDETILAACPRLRVVGRHGVGLDTVDLDAATRHGVAVVHAPGSNSHRYSPKLHLGLRRMWPDGHATSSTHLAPSERPMPPLH